MARESDAAGEGARQAPAKGEGRRKAAFGFIFASSLLNAISFGIMIPVLPNLIKQFVGGDTATASEWNVLFAVTWGVVQFFTSPVLGLLSDRIGRRPVLLISLFGLAADFLLIALAPSLAWLFVGRVLNGATAASFSTAGAYVADVTAPEARAKAFGWIGSAFSFGFLVGPVFGGLLAEVSLRLPFFVAAGLTLANCLYGALILPESLPRSRRAARFDLRKANPVGSLTLLRSHADLLGLASVGFLYQLAHTVLPNIFVLYTGYRYGWTPAVMGMTLMATGLSGVLVQSLLVGPVVARIGERGAVLLGAACAAAGFIIYAIAPTGLIYLLATPVFAGANFLQPGLQGLMTRRVAASEQGQLQGANQSLTGMAAVIGPLLFGLTFAWSIDEESAVHLPGLAVFIAAALMAAAGLLALAVTRDYQRPPRVA